MQKHFEDNLDGILIAVYQQEINKLTDVILANLGYLISANILDAQADAKGTTRYAIKGDKKKIEEFLKGVSG